jgi:2'-phosphotransferase
MTGSLLTTRSQLQWRKLKSIKVTFDEVRQAVDSSDKKRFALLHIPSAQATESTTKATTVPVTTPGCEGVEDTAAPTAGEDQSSTTVLEAPVSTEDQQSATAQALLVTDTDPSNFLIRATQGHSIKTVEAASFLEPLSLSDESKLPDTVVHGTFHGAWPAILQSGGLQCMGRNHVHFATGPSLESVLAAQQDDSQKNDTKKNQVISGMRKDAQVLIYIDLKKALAAGCPFWRSENGVILSEGIPVTKGDGETDGNQQKVVSVEFFDVVVEKKAGLGKIWERGEVLQELPARLTSKGTPKGNPKGNRR